MSRCEENLRLASAVCKHWRPISGDANGLAHERHPREAMAEPLRPRIGPAEPAVDHTTGGCDNPRDSCRAAGRTPRSSAFFLGASMEPGPSPRIVTTGMERPGKGFRPPYDSGPGLPSFRSPRPL